MSMGLPGSSIYALISIPQIDGEANFDIPMGHISQIMRNLKYRSIVVYAYVTEEINNFRLSSNSRVAFHDQAEIIEFLRSNPKNFKPGLPYVAYVSGQSFS